MGGRTVLIDECDFISNVAGIQGGAIAHLDSTTEVIISNSRFMKNISAQFGGGIYAITPFVINGTIFARNEARDSGGAIVCVNGASFSGLTLALNRAPIGSAIFYGSPLDSPLQGPGISLSVSNSIIAFSEGGQPVSCEDTALIVFSCCDVYGNSAGDWVGCLTGLDQTNDNFSADPLLRIGIPRFPNLRRSLHFVSGVSVPPPRRLQVDRRSRIGRVRAHSDEECSLQETTWGQVKAAYR